jgi:predicted solute-binding protein
MILSINKYYKNIMYLYNRHQNNIIKNIQMILVKLKFKKLIKEINHWKIRFIK